MGGAIHHLTRRRNPSTRSLQYISIGNTMAHSLLVFLGCVVTLAAVFGADQATVTMNESELASSGIGCRCCWQGCDFQSKGTQLIAVEGQSGLEDTSALEEVDAWLVYHAQHQDFGYYTPLLETVQEGVESQGAVARIIWSNEMDSMITAVKGAVAAGRRPLVFTVAHDWVPRREVVLGNLKQAKVAGAYLVSYNSEPSGHEYDHTGILSYQAKVLDWAAQMGADEVWDYSIAQVQHYLRHGNMPIIRYVPPGYTTKLDTGVNVNSKLSQTAVLGYLGGKTNKSCSKTYERLLGDKLHEEGKVWTLAALRMYMEKYPLQLNQHKSQTCSPRQRWEDEFQHFESFRMAVVLTNKACVISPPAAVSEMKVWKGMVTFVEVEDTNSTMVRLAQNLDQCRNQAYETYKREFAAPKLLQQSGFFKAWRPPHGI